MLMQDVQTQASCGAVVLCRSHFDHMYTLTSSVLHLQLGLVHSCIGEVGVLVHTS